MREHDDTGLMLLLRVLLPGVAARGREGTSIAGVAEAVVAKAVEAVALAQAVRAAGVMARRGRQAGHGHARAVHARMHAYRHGRVLRQRHHVARACGRIVACNTKEATGPPGQRKHGDLNAGESLP